MRFTRSMIEKPEVHFAFNPYVKYWRHSTKWDDNNILVVDFVRKSRVSTHRANIRIISKSMPIWKRNGKGEIFGQAKSTCYIGRDGIPQSTDTKKDNKSQDNSNLEDWEPYMQKIYDSMKEGEWF